MQHLSVCNGQSNFRSQTDSHGHDYVLLNGEVSRVQDAKKNFVFSLHCKGVPEMYFAVNDEESYFEWLTKIGAACNSGTYTYIHHSIWV